jgi:hypothetical protein
MSDREYYSIRTGKHPYGKRLPPTFLRRLFISVYRDFESGGYFQEAFGYDCVDAGYVPGKAGGDIESYMLMKLRKEDLWPIDRQYEHYDENDLFDVIELLYDHVSKPTEGKYHSWSNCGWHYYEFDKQAGQEEFRAKMNELLRDYGEGYELSQHGEVFPLPEQGMSPLLEAQLPHYDPQNVEARVELASQNFRNRRASIADKRNAVRDLFDVLEYLRPKVKEVLTDKDEDDLFNIANNFGIRHHRRGQKTQYDQLIWLNWMFYFCLATIHAVLGLIKKKEECGG